MTPKPTPPPEISCREAGRRGGTTTKQRHGAAFYRAIARAGGQANAAAHDHAYFVALGRRGGQRLAALVAEGKAAEKAAR